MVAAMKAVTEKKKVCAKAAEKYDVPRKSLENRVKGHVMHGVLSGPATMLTSEEEKAINGVP